MAGQRLRQSSVPVWEAEEYFCDKYHLFTDDRAVTPTCRLCSKYPPAEAHEGVWGGGNLCGGNCVTQRQAHSVSRGQAFPCDAAPRVIYDNNWSYEQNGERVPLLSHGLGTDTRSKATRHDATCEI